MGSTSQRSTLALAPALTLRVPTFAGSTGGSTSQRSTASTRSLTSRLLRSEAPSSAAWLRVRARARARVRVEQGEGEGEGQG